MGQFQPPADPSTVWLSGLIEAMDEVAASAAKPSAADREALATRLELPAMPAPLRAFIHPADHRPADRYARRSLRRARSH
jgi:hypothetical protein